MQDIQTANDSTNKASDCTESSSASTKMLSECNNDVESKSNYKRDDIAKTDGSIDFNFSDLKKLYGGDDLASKATNSDVAAKVNQANDNNTAPQGDKTAAPYEPQQAGNYHGELIMKDVEPGVVTDTKGKTIHTIAKAHLGADATPQELQKYESEITKLNHLNNPNKALDGSPITLPGHTKDGGFVTVDSDGNKKTTWGDGAVRVENKDHTGYAMHPAKDGSYSEHHWGPKPEDNYEVRKTADGKYQVAEAFSPDFKDAQANDPRAERAKLRDMAESKIKDPKALARFEEDMVRMDARAQQLEESYKKDGMSADDAHKKAQEEVAKTYQQIERLMEKNDKAAVSEQKRIELAEQVMHQAANPTSISQGGYNTCNVTVTEVRAYTVNPSEAARMVSDVALTGEYTSNGTPPTHVKIDKDSLQPHGEAKENPPADGSRSYASQLFEVTAVNLYYAKEHANGGPDIHYEQHEGKKGAKPAADNGERLVDYSDAKNPKEVGRAPGLPDEGIVKVEKEIVKDADPDAPTMIKFDEKGETRKKLEDLKKNIFDLDMKINHVSDGTPLNLDDANSVKAARDAINSKSDLDQAHKDKLNQELDDLVKEHKSHNEDGIANIRDEKQLEAYLATAKMPVTVKVFTYHEPFTTDSGEKDTGDPGGGHVVTITAFHPAEAGPPAKPARIEYDNQWGKDGDHFGDKAVSVHDLFQAMQSSQGMTDLQVAKHTMDKTSADYDKEMEQLLLRSERRWAKEERDGTYDKTEHDQVVQAWREELNSLKPESRKQAIIKKLAEDMKAENLTDPSSRH
jgi:hypothetical protein